MPKKLAQSSPSKVLFGFFWWLHMWGHSIVDPFWNWVRQVSIWNDLEEMIADLPWFFGMFFWVVPVVFFAILWLMGFYAMIFSGFLFTGLLAAMIGKFFGAGWIRYGQKVMHPVLLGMPWYDKQFVLWSNSKKVGLHAFHKTALSKSVKSAYNIFKSAFGHKLILIKARIKQFQDDRQ